MAGETILNGRYRLVAQQGTGGMSVIYRAIDERLGRTVAIKILRPSLTSDPAFLERFVNEARSVANLAHPNIVTVHDVGNDGQAHYIVMELVDGQDLKKIIRTFGALGVERSLKIAIQLCAGIGFAHRSGLVHADVKPQNILVKEGDEVKVTDFGIAQAWSDTHASSGLEEMVWGSPHYFAPEQARGERPTPAADVYSIGIVLFEMLTGRLPYTGTSHRELALAHIQSPIPLVSEFNPAVPESLVRVVHNAMRKEPHARYSMADQLGNLLKSHLDRASRASSPAPSPPASSRPPAAQTMARPPAVPPAQPPAPPPQRPPSEPTQRFGAAPVAPNYGPRPGVPAPGMPPAPPDMLPGQQGPGMQPSGSFPPPQQRYPGQPVQADSGRFYAAQYREDAGEPDGLDFVTIALAALAFIAVAGLIPLYIFVFQLRAG